MDDHLESCRIVVGVDRAPITPAVGVPLIGYPDERPNQGSWRDLWAQAIVFGEVGAGVPAAALIVLDNIEVDATIVAAIRAAAAERVEGLSGDSIMVAATHTHSGGGLCRWNGADDAPTVDEAYIRHVIESAAAAAGSAWRHRGVATVRAGAAEAHLHHNRRPVSDNGRAENVWIDVDGKHTGYVNPRLPFIVLERAGRIAAVLVSYGCHPVTLGPENVKAAPDFPGWLVDAITDGAPADAAVYLTGACGDVNPRECLHQTPKQAQRMGQALAAAVLSEMRHATPIMATPIRTAHTPLRLSLRDDAEQRYRLRAQADSPDGRSVVSEIQVLRIGQIGIVSAPGELFAETGARIERASPLAFTSVAGYANDYIGYLPTDAAFAEGGYEGRATCSTDIAGPIESAALSALAATLD